MKIYTKTGDTGETSLVTGTRVKKYHPRIEAYGTVDELNSYIGLIRSFDIDKISKDILLKVQEKLFTICSQLSKDETLIDFQLPVIYKEDIEFLEKQIDIINEIVPPLRNFILPGGHQIIAFTHIARTVCRRAERLTVKLAENDNVNEIIITYLNRLSDFLFMLARKFAQNLSIEEINWKPSL